MEETAKRFKTLERTREAGTAQDYGSVVPGLILGVRNQSVKLASIFIHNPCVKSFSKYHVDKMIFPSMISNGMDSNRSPRHGPDTHSPSSIKNSAP